ncbi:GntR family transcriptional regulator [Acidisoma cellulosilytica]|uniref:GntR family transcriptional regulator n=1 Tax=Acidisoma cellulosilyticum TaxID=2802395 RepID=A0A963Z5R2_9PROT|nr:GntR family transcriptional regulator [Acidisoma cellulosilyticum]MCB8883138.1 GntR family transcriptional regulator [Acidisoma cellulosilyticum]
MPLRRRGDSTNLPRYLQVKAALLEKRSSMSAFATFPSERDLCEELNVSRTTIRRALAELEKDGAVRRLVGKGTFTDETKYTDHAMQSFIGFDEDARTQHRLITNKILSQTVILCPPEAAQRLGLRTGDRLFLLERLRFIDGLPMCLVTAMLPLDLCPGLLDQDFANSSLYDFLRQHDIVTTLAKRSIEVKPASMEEAAHLEISDGAPVFLFESIGFTRGNKPLDYVRSRYPAYKARFETEVRGAANDEI